MTSPTLDEIINHKRIEVEALKARLKRMGSTTVMRTIANVRSIAELLGTDGLTVIPELKAADPWRGVFRDAYDANELSQAFEAGGAPALAIQTDSRFFNGSYDDLFVAARRTNIPILMRDFVIDEAQLTQAKAVGADAAMLFAQLLDEDTLRALIDFAKLIMLEVVVEVLDEADVDKALACDAAVIGVLNRDVRSQTIKLDRAPALRNRIPDAVRTVAIGGMLSGRDLKVVRDSGFDGAVVGETLMRAEDPVAAFKAMIVEMNA